tara:strand:- start:590 stop:1885 length:1296 start_codon:yes stop_codon:yes gene_type:complete
MAQNSAGGSGGSSRYRSDVATLTEESTTGVTPEVQITYTSSTEGSGGSDVTVKTTISGSQTKTLTVESDSVGIQTVRCLIKHPTAALYRPQALAPEESDRSDGVFNDGLVSNTRNFETISSVNSQLSNLTYELVRDDDVNRFATLTQNLFLGPLNLQATTINFDMTRAITIFPKDENLAVRIQMAASAGQSFNGNKGGEGGQCTFTTTLLKNTEYTFKLGATVEPTSSIGRGGAGAYFYEKGRLLVACGGGGASGWYGGSGGDGGGAGVAGASGSGSNRGAGGIKYNDGNLPAAGVLPSGATGGKIESCTTGGYWNTQGFSPCSDIGQRKFVLANGQTNNSTQTILRGYKAADVNSDYGFRHNGGNSQVIGANGLFVGGGGAGAGGGNAASGADSGGGGASGYSNGSVTMISAQQGGNPNDKALAQITLIT